MTAKSLKRGFETYSMEEVHRFEDESGIYLDLESAKNPYALNGAAIHLTELPATQALYLQRSPGKGCVLRCVDGQYNQDRADGLVVRKESKREVLGVLSTSLGAPLMEKPQPRQTRSRGKKRARKERVNRRSAKATSRKVH